MTQTAFHICLGVPRFVYESNPVVELRGCRDNAPERALEQGLKIRLGTVCWEVCCLDMQLEPFRDGSLVVLVLPFEQMWVH